MNISDLIEEQSILIHPQIEDRKAFLQHMAGRLLPGGGNELDTYRLVVEQCRSSYTSVEHGALLLFYETDSIVDVRISMAILKQAQLWEENRPSVSLIFMIAHNREKPEYYLTLLSQLSRALCRRSLFSALLKAKTASEARDILAGDDLRRGRQRERRKAQRKVSNDRRSINDRRGI